MATQEQQMKMILQDGGMQGDGMSRDPVSGNEVPPGSLSKEVRDDIPAQLSEGEYVVPADVVQYFGVKFFEDLRNEAKMGLSKMASNGRIGGEPVSETPTDFPFDISELQIASEEKPMMNKGGVIYADEGVFTGVSGNTTSTGTGGLDYTKTDKYFNQENAQKGQMTRYVTSGCKQVEVLTTGNRVPIKQGGDVIDDVQYYDITSDQGLNIIQSCSNINLNEEEERLVIQNIGQDEYDKWKSGEKRSIDDDLPEEPEPPISRDDDDGRYEPEPDDFIQNWGMDKMGDYLADVNQYYGADDSTSLIGKMIKGISKPLVALNHKHIVARAIKMLNEGEYVDYVGTPTRRQLSDVQRKTLENILKTNPDGMIKGTFKAGGMKITWNPETGTYESDSFNPQPTIAEVILNSEKNTPGLPKIGVTQDMYDKAGVYQGDYTTSGVSSIPKSGSANMANRSIMYRDKDGIKSLMTSVDTQKAASKPARSEEDKKYADNFEREERKKDAPGYESRQSSAVATGTATKEGKGGTKKSAEGMSEDDDRRSTEQAGMAGQDTTSLAAGKFGGNKGGLAKRRKRTTNKK